MTSLLHQYENSVVRHVNHKQSSSSSAQMKRVRKEVRDLPTLEWDAIVKALWIMKETTDSDGILLYGKHFISYDSMISKHMTAAFDPRGDQAHFGPVLGMFHRVWLIQLERSLRAVDSGIEALPYWDFTKDVFPLSSNYTSIFDDRYFGSYKGQGPGNSVVNGKFANWPITKGHSKWRNSFGYMRHPLSPNKSPILTRKGGAMCGYNITLGDPQMWNMCLDVGSKISEWTACIDSNIHGPAHSSIAGSWRREDQIEDSPFCSQWYGFIAAPKGSPVINPSSVSRYPYGSFINPYSINCFECPNCIGQETSTSCMCVPRNENSECGPLWTNLLNTGNARGRGSFLRRGYNMTSVIHLANIADIQILGDMGDPAASPNDPIFWAHHANIDRHFETWLIKYSSASVREEYYGYPTEGFAPGCNLYDVINSFDPFHNLDDFSGASPYTVKDVFDLFTGDQIPYTYDTIIDSRTQRRPPPLSLREAKVFLQTPHEESLRRSLETEVKCEKDLCADHAIALGGILRGVYEKYTVPRIYSIVPYYVASGCFLVGIYFFQHLLRKLLCGVRVTLQISPGKDLKVSITREMKKNNIVNRQLESLEPSQASTTITGGGAENNFTTDRNPMGLGLHSRTPRSAEEVYVKSP